MKRSTESVLDARDVQRVREWLARGGIAILGGRPGIGVSATLEAIWREADLDPVVVAHPSGAKKTFLEDVLSSAVTVDGRRKVLVLDHILDDAHNETLAVLRQWKATRVPIVCTVRSAKAPKLADAVKLATLVVDFAPPSASRIEARLRLSAAADVPSAVVRAIAVAARGDLRNALCALRQKSAARVKDEFVDGLQASQRLLQRRGVGGGCVDEAIRLFGGDPTTCSMAMFEHYLEVQAAWGDDIAEVADAFSQGDVVENVIFGKQAAELNDLYASLMVATPAVLLPASTEGIDVVRFGTVWSRVHTQLAKAKTLRRAVTGQRAAAGLPSFGAEDLSLLRAGLRARIGMGDVQGAAALCASAGLDAEGLLCIMRLWTSGYTRAMHEKMKKALSTSLDSSL